MEAPIQINSIPIETNPVVNIVPITQGVTGASLNAIRIPIPTTIGIRIPMPVPINIGAKVLILNFNKPPFYIGDDGSVVKNGHPVSTHNLLEKIVSPTQLQAPPAPYTVNVLGIIYSKLSHAKPANAFLKKDQILAPPEHFNVNIDYDKGSKGLPLSPFLNTEIIQHINTLLSNAAVYSNSDGSDKTTLWSGIALPAVNVVKVE
jgi:hypothetical protein